MQFTYTVKNNIIYTILIIPFTYEASKYHYWQISANNYGTYKMRGAGENQDSL